MNAVLLAVLTTALAFQGPDTTAPSFSDPDRIVIDAAAIVREGGVHSLADLLNSRVPGLLVVSGSGLNGGGSRIRFAGPRRLLSDGMPLILVDGIRVDATADASLFDLGGPGPLRLEDLNVEDIASIEVLRSPAGAMLYGPGAADGAILITTKRGRSGAFQVDGYAQGILESVPSRWPANYGGVDLDNPDPRMRNGGCSLAHQAAGYCVQDFVQSFNPLVQRSPFAAAIRHHAGVNATGGPRWGAFRVGAGVDGDGGVYDIPVVRNPDSYSRWNVTAGGTIQPHRNVDLVVTVHRLSSNLELPAYAPVKSALLGPSDSSGFAWTPMFGSAPREKVGRVSGVVEANARPFPWLSLRGLMGLDRVDQGDTAVAPGQSRSYGRRWVKQTSAALSVTATGTAGQFRFRTILGVDRVEGRRRVDLRTGADTDPFCTGACLSQILFLRHRTYGAFVSEQVSIRERLVVTAAVREDHFREYRQHQTNPSLAVAWLAQRNGRGVMSGLRLRAGYGSASETGSLDAIPLVFVRIGTVLPALRPDRVKSLEAGADAQLFGGRWNASITAYDLRSNVMRIVPLPNVGGVVFAAASGSKLGNRGVVATLAGTLLDWESLHWDVQLSLWGNRNRVRSLVGPEQIVNGYQGLLRNYPTGGYWGERITGYADANGDGIIDGSEVTVSQSPTWAGTPYPTQGAGLQSSVRLGQRVRISTTLDYRAGQVLLNQGAWYRCWYAAVCRDRNDPQTPLERQAVAVAPAFAVPLQYFEDADYLKLRELQLSFDVPPRTVGVLGANHATISLAARNLFTWTRYSGGDPEAGSYGSMVPGGIPTVADFGTIPVARTWALQVRVSY